MPVFPKHLGPITIQPTYEFIHAEGPLLKVTGRSTPSFGMFKKQKTNKIFVGKSDCLFGANNTSEKQISIIGRSYLEKVTYDIYRYFGANTPENTLSMQKPVNLHKYDLEILNNEYPPHTKFLHIMSELIPGYHDYCKQKNYNLDSLYNDVLVLPSGKQLKQKGLGIILAVALFIADVDVVGRKGTNIGFVIMENIFQKKYAQIVKIDPGQAFHNGMMVNEYTYIYSTEKPLKSKTIESYKITDRTIKVCCYIRGTEIIKFDDLAKTIKEEFLLTLHDIINTTDETIKKFFIRANKYNLIKDKSKEVASLIKHLKSRRDKLKDVYANELIKTKKLYKQQKYLAPIIIRPSNDFIYAKEPLLGGSTPSSGIFIEEKTYKNFVGKSDCLGTANNTFKKQISITGSSYLEKIAYDIYGYFGAYIPENTLSMQNYINLAEIFIKNCIPKSHVNAKFLHIMSELIPGYHDYCKRNKNTTAPQTYLKSLYNDVLVLPSGKQLKQKGLGIILAVALFIDDIDVVGRKGTNIGFVIMENIFQKKYAQIVKIDPGQAFHDGMMKYDYSQLDPNTRTIELYKITDKTIQYKTFSSIEGKIKFNNLAQTIQQEFLLTLHDIINTTDETIKKFFIRANKYNLIKDESKKVASLIKHLKSRRETLKKLYWYELAKTKLLYEQQKNSFIENKV